MRRILLALLLLAVAAPALAQTNPIPADRRTDWSYAGVPGGIPTYSQICVALGVAGQAPTYAQTVTATTIQNYVTSCASSYPNGSVIALSAGTYTFLTPVLINRSKVVIRGAGADQTVIKHDPSNSALFHFQGAGREALTKLVTGGGSKGSFTFTVADTSGLSVGQIIELSRDNESYTRSNYHAVPLYAQFFNKQVNRIANINGTTITVQNPLAQRFDSGNAQIYQVWNSGYVTGSGLEDLKLDHSTYTSAGWTSVVISGAYACWIKGIESYRGRNYHVQLQAALNVEIRDSYFHLAQVLGSNNSGILFSPSGWDNGNVENIKIENCIFDRLFPGVEFFGPSTGNVIAYNYVSRPEPGPNPGDIWVTWTLMVHNPHPMLNLYEGNTSPMIGSDGYNGSSSHETYFRNLLTGATNRVDAIIPVGNAIQLKRLSYYYNILGNVIGSTETNPSKYEEYGEYCGGVPCTAPYQLGYPNIGNESLICTVLPYTCSDPGTYPDANVAATLFRWGNYDFFYDTVRWSASELGGVTQPASQVLPSSMYLTSKPAWFGSVAWPPIGPDVTATTHGGVGTVDASGHANKIPAQLCWESRSLITGGTFNASSCYAGAAAAPNAPTNVRIR